MVLECVVVIVFVEDMCVFVVLSYVDWCGSCKVFDLKVKVVWVVNMFDGVEFVIIDYML